MRVYSVLKTKRFWISFAIEALMFSLIGVLFSGIINNSFKVLETWSNCDSSYIAYDSRKFDDNCYAFYGNDVRVNLSRGDSIRIKSDVYQFLENVNYDSRSLLNEKNVIAGEYKELSSNEMCISAYLSKEYGINIGDRLFVDGTDEYTIKYIYRDFGNIKEPKIQTEDSVLFLGVSSNPLRSSYQFAVFNNVTKDYNNIYIFNKALKPIKNNLIIYSLICSVLFVIPAVISIVLSWKPETKHLYKVFISGDRKRFLGTILAYNFLILILPALLSGFAILILGSWVIACYLFGVCMLAFITKMLCLRLKIN